jgi:predicted ArsR family transcriptional regulator
MIPELPASLDRQMHPLCDRAIMARILRVVNSNHVVCIQEAAKEVGCADITAKKHLARIVKAGLATEKRIGRARVFLATDRAIDDEARGSSELCEM